MSKKVTLPRRELLIAILQAAIDDLGHTDNMTDRTNYFLFLGESDEYVDYHDMIAACEWGITTLGDPDE